jgi:putative peptidoglycan lipid II flippase
LSTEFGSKQIIRGTLITSSLTILSRLLGFLRDLIVALVYGAGSFADAYFVAFRIPNLLRSFVAEGALSAAFVPIFSSELQHGREQAQQALRAVTSFLLVSTGAISLIGFVFASEIIGLIAPGFLGEQRDTAVLLLRIMLPYTMCISLVAMVNGALASLKTFGTAAAAQSIMNVVLILGGLISAVFEMRSGVIILSASVLVGGIAQVLFQIPALRRHQLQLSFGFSGAGPLISQLLKLMAPAIIGATVYQLMIFSATILSSLLEPGSISWLFYADRIVQLPLGIFSIALSSVLLPALATNAAVADASAFARNLANALRYNSFILLPVSALIFISADEVIKVLFQRGAFDARSVEMTASAVRALSVGIWAASCQSLLARSFMAKRDNLTPTIFGVITLVLNVVLSLTLMGSIVSSDASLLVSLLTTIQQTLAGWIPQADLGHVGLALASSLSSLASFVLFALTFHSRQKDFHWALFLNATAKSLLAALAALLLSAGIEFTFAQEWLRLILTLSLFPLSYLGVALLLRSQEAQEFLEIAKARFS